MNESDGGLVTAGVGLPETLDISAAEGLLAILREHVRPGAACRLDASSVRVLTTPCAQLLIAAANACPDLVIENPSPEFEAGASDLGVTEHLFKRT